MIDITEWRADMRGLWCVVFTSFFVSIFFGSVSVNGQQHAGQYSQADITFGARIYSENCSSCHGVNGDTVAGVNFRSGQFRNVSSDYDLRNVMTNGISDTAMPPGEYTDAELSGLIAFLRTMGSIDLGDLAIGDLNRGQMVFVNKGDCQQCHRVAGIGSRLGPDLTDIGSLRSAGQLERKLLDPTSSMLPVNRPFRGITKNGTVVSGLRLNEDTFSVQIINEDEKLVTVEKADLREYEFLDVSPMPSYGDQLSEQELSDLLAYLLSLKGVD